MNELFSPAALASQVLYVDKGSNRIVFLHEIYNFRVKILAVFHKIKNISTVLAVSNSMSSFVPKYWLNGQLLVAIFNELHGQRLPCMTCVQYRRGRGVQYRGGVQ